MPFLGSQPETGYKTVAKQDITGTGATVYTLDYKVATAAEVEVFVNNVRQEPEVAYTVSGNQITFTTAVDSGDDCYVVFQGRAVTSNLIESANIADGAITAAKLASGAVPTEITKSTSNPAYNTNGSVGDIHLNTQTGEMFVCTDDTTDLNVWTNIGDGSGTIRLFTATGGTETTYTDSGLTYKVHTFTSSGTFTVTVGSNSIEYLVIGGGGGGGANRGGGGGAGGYRSSVVNEASGRGTLAESKLSVATGSYTVTVGAGGAASPSAHDGDGGQGSNSAFGSIVSLGGGLGRSDDEVGAAGGSGAGGGGGGVFAGGSGTSGQGYDGGNGISGVGWGNPGGGGGGAGSAGRQATGGSSPDGGDGVESSITGTAVIRASGGGGGYGDTSTRAAPTPGGGGQSGNAAGNNATAGTANTGGGGGGGGLNSYPGQAGGSGIVIIRYAI